MLETAAGPEMAVIYCRAHRERAQAVAVAWRWITGRR